MAIRYLTAGESHGKGLTVILEGVPAGLPLTSADIAPELKARKEGYGRGGRQKIESDDIDITAGVRHGRTIASPICIHLPNKDYANWVDKMDPEGQVPPGYEPFSVPRPGHADFAGITKYGFDDIRNVLERSSARETAIRVAAGAVAKKILAELDIRITAYVLKIGGVALERELSDVSEIIKQTEGSPVRTIDKAIEAKMMKRIEEAHENEVTVGGKYAVVAENVPIGLGSYVQWDRKLDGLIARALMGTQAVKGVEFGMGFEVADLFGSDVHDAFELIDGHVSRARNNAGGIEGGMTNGQPIVVKVAMKPIPTMKKPLSSIDLKDMSVVNAFYERSDTCAVPAASVVGENVVAIEIANALIEKFGGDSMGELKSRLKQYRQELTRLKRI